MSEAQRKIEVFSGLRGRDGSITSHLAIPPYKAIECLNVDGYRVGLARKRGGATSVSLSGSGLTGKVSAAHRHVPGAAESAAECWLVDDAATPIIARYSGGAWANPTIKSNIASRSQDVNMVSFNGKLFILADTSVDRVQVFDPNSSTTALVYAGHVTPNAPTVADTGAGSYAALGRYYKITWITRINTTQVIRRSELSSASSLFTPSGSGTAARIYRPVTLPGEGETQWEVYVSLYSNGPFYYLKMVDVANTYTDDNVDTADYSYEVLAPLAGNNTPLASYKYGIADSARMLFAGGWETGTAQNRVFITRPLLSTSAVFYDDEVVATDSNVDLDEKDSGFITGFGGPIENQIVVFKNSQTWRLIPTSNPDQPYRRKPITKKIGCIRQQTVVMAEDDSGHPTLYWLSQQGPYRLGVNGLARLTWDVQDIWDTVNLAASDVVAHGVYHEAKRQVWWWVATGASNEPDTILMFDVDKGRMTDTATVRDGWYKFTGAIASARCSMMFSNTFGATMSRDLKPHIGQHGAVTRFWKCDTTDQDDAGTDFQALVTYPARHFGGLARRCQIDNPLVIGKVGSHSLTVTLTRDYGAESRTDSESMAAISDGTAETRIVKRFEGAFTADASCVAVSIGDASAVDSGQWEVDAVVVPYEQRESL